MRIFFERKLEEVTKKKLQERNLQEMFFWYDIMNIIKRKKFSTEIVGTEKKGLILFINTPLSSNCSKFMF